MLVIGRVTENNMKLITEQAQKEKGISEFGLGSDLDNFITKNETKYPSNLTIGDNYYYGKKIVLNNNGLILSSDNEITPK